MNGDQQSEPERRTGWSGEIHPAARSHMPGDISLAWRHTVRRTAVPSPPEREPLTDSYPAAGLNKFDLGMVPASITPPSTWRRAAWFAVLSSAATLSGLVVAASALVSTSTPTSVTMDLPHIPQGGEYPPLPTQGSQDTAQSGRRTATSTVATTSAKPDGTVRSQRQSTPRGSATPVPPPTINQPPPPDTGDSQPTRTESAPAEQAMNLLSGLLAPSGETRSGQAPSSQARASETRSGQNRPAQPPSRQALSNETPSHQALAYRPQSRTQAAAKATEAYFTAIAGGEFRAAYAMTAGQLRKDGFVDFVAPYADAASIRILGTTVGWDSTVSTLRIVREDGTVHTQQRRLRFTDANPPRITADEAVN